MNGILLGIEIAAGICIFYLLFFKVGPFLLLPARGWWYMRVARNVTPPPEVRRYLMKSGMKKLHGADLSPDAQFDIAVAQLAAATDETGTFDEMTGDLLQDALARLGKAQQAIQQKKQEIIDTGAAEGKTISTEAILKHVLKLKTTYSGADPEGYGRDIDAFVEDFRRRHGPEIPVDTAYSLLRELEAKHGRVE